MVGRVSKKSLYNSVHLEFTISKCAKFSSYLILHKESVLEKFYMGLKKKDLWELLIKCVNIKIKGNCINLFKHTPHVNLGRDVF